jgi:hypothetical protein
METSRIRGRVYFLLFTLCIILTADTSALEPADEKQIRTVLSAKMDLVHQGWALPPDAKTYEKKYGPALSPYLREYTTNTGEPFAVIDIEALCTKYGAALFPYLDEYTTDPNSRIRSKAYILILKIGSQANDPRDRKAAVYRLLSCLRRDQKHKQGLGRKLLRFRAADFSDEAKDLLRQLFSQALIDNKMNGYVRGYIILLVGIADIKSELPRLKEFMKQREVELKKKHEKHVQGLRRRIESTPERNKLLLENLYKDLNRQYWQSTLMWNALRARARMGVKEDILRCIELVESHPDQRYKVHSLLAQLSYVRRPEVVNYLQKSLNRGKTTPEFIQDMEISSEAQCAAMALAKMLRGFPGNPEYGGNHETIVQCRKWMAEQTEWKIIR